MINQFGLFTYSVVRENAASLENSGVLWKVGNDVQLLDEQVQGAFD